MIIKYFDLKKNLNNDVNFYLLYGSNLGLIEEIIDKVFKVNFSKNIYNFDEKEIINNVNQFKESIYNRSFFENKKLIIINRASDKIHKIIEELVASETDDIKIIIKAGVLDKKSKLRNFFEKNIKTIISPFYEDNLQSLVILAQNYFKEKKIPISAQHINIIVERSKGSRISLKNELEKIFYFSKSNSSIKIEEILKLTNTFENYSASELVDHYLVKNEKKTLMIINENNPSIEDNIVILRTLLSKIKRLRKIKTEAKESNNYDAAIANYKPPIFWKDKDIIKKQLKLWSISQIDFLIIRINNLELLIKKNSNISNQILNNFILNKNNNINNYS
tara:strand:+ start:1156 stop:2157 length:1002 start_codon:yes stop_codon:yes gene_type:complete